MELVANKDDQQTLEMGKDDAGGILQMEKENVTGSSHPEGNSIDMDSAYGTGDVEEMLDKVKASMREENDNLRQKLEKEKDENDNLRQNLEKEKDENDNLRQNLKKEKDNSKEHGFLMVKLENSKDENTNLRAKLENEKEEIGRLEKDNRDLKDDNHKFMMGKAIEKQLRSKLKDDIVKLEKEIEETNQHSGIEALQEEINKLKKSQITQQSLEEHEILKIKYQETEDALNRLNGQMEELNKEMEGKTELIEKYKEIIENLQTNYKISKESMIETNRKLKDHLNSYEELSKAQQDIIEKFKNTPQGEIIVELENALEKYKNKID